METNWTCTEFADLFEAALAYANGDLAEEPSIPETLTFRAVQQAEASSSDDPGAVNEAQHLGADDERSQAEAAKSTTRPAGMRTEPADTAEKRQLALFDEPAS